VTPDSSCWWAKILNGSGISHNGVIRTRAHLCSSKSDAAPMEITARFVNDKVSLADRLGSRYFLNVLKRNGIELWYKVTNPKLGKRAHTRKRKKGESDSHGIVDSLNEPGQMASHCYMNIGQAPGMDVVSNWRLGCRTHSENPGKFVPLLCYKEKIEPGDVVNAEILRQMHGYKEGGHRPSYGSASYDGRWGG
jgi:hypothetical protein